MLEVECYARMNEEELDQCRHNPEWLKSLYGREREAVEVVDIDAAREGLLWVLSRLEPQRQGSAFDLYAHPAALLKGEGALLEKSITSEAGASFSLSPGKVKEINAWLQAVSAADVRKAYDPVQMSLRDRVSPGMWSDEALPAFEDYILPAFQKVRAFFSRAARDDQYVLVFASSGQRIRSLAGFEKQPEMDESSRL